MALDIFSSFDDHHKIMSNMFMLMWVLIIFPGLILNMYYLFNSKNKVMLNLFKKTAHMLLSQSKARGLGGSLSILSTILTILIVLNLLGLTPYLYSTTSHLAVNISLALPTWLCVMLLSALYNFKKFMAHFQPIGAPSALNPFLVIIELVSVCVRPLTLMVRLSANLSAGHILMALLGGAFSTTGFSFTTTLISLIGCFYFMFEMAVCFVQAYIFTLLSGLYLDEHPN